MSNQLLSFSDAELENELKRRGIVREAPKPLENLDFSKLTRTVMSVVNARIQNGYGHHDDADSIYEAAVEAVYGPQIWNTLNHLGG